MRHIWKPSEVKKLIELYPNTQNKVLAEIFCITEGKISNKAYSLGLRKSEAYMQSPECGRIMKGQRVGIGTEFKKGMVPKNKGKKQTEYMSIENIAKTVATRFKKGSIPHNTKPIGYERITVDGYVEVKVRNAPENGNNKNFELKHRILWEQHHGPIPKGMIVEFLPGADRINFTINDLVMRSRYENMIANSFCDNAIVKRFLGVREPELIEKIKSEAPELIAVKRKTLLLNQKINKKCQ